MFLMVTMVLKVVALNDEVVKVKNDFIEEEPRKVYPAELLVYLVVLITGFFLLIALQVKDGSFGTLAAAVRDSLSFS